MVVNITVIKSCWSEFITLPFLLITKKTKETPNEAIIATISPHAVIRHQNHRNR